MFEEREQEQAQRLREGQTNIRASKKRQYSGTYWSFFFFFLKTVKAGLREGEEIKKIQETVAASQRETRKSCASVGNINKK